MKNVAIVLVVMLLAIGNIGFVGCSSGVSQDEYDELELELQTVNAQLQAAQAKLETSENELQSVKGELDTADDELQSTKEQLEKLEAVCPPGSFESVSELEQWVSAHLKKETTEYIDSTFRNAVQIQKEGLEDGYLVSIDLDYFPDDETWIVWCNAFAGNTFYEWYPEEELYDGVTKLGFEK